jgi:tetratricopeptide (TPR) repeat protein
MWARVGLEVAAEHGLEARRGSFASWLSNALVWGNSDARESLRSLGDLLARETRRRSRGALLSGIALTYGFLGDRARAEAADAEQQVIAAELGIRRQWFRWMFTLYALGDIPAALEAADAEEAALAAFGETGTRSTVVGLQAWMLALTGDSEAAVRLAEQSRQLGAVDDAVTQILWQASAGLAQGQIGNLEEADRLSAGAVAAAADTDSLSAADAWEGRARVLAMLGRRSEMLEAAAKARELYAAKGSVNFLRRLDRFLAEQEVAVPAMSRPGRSGGNPGHIPS